MRNLIISALVAILMAPAPTLAQTQHELEDTLRIVLENLSEIYTADLSGEYERSRKFFADSVSCVSAAHPGTCRGWEHRRITYASTPIRARLMLGQEEGWAFDLPSLNLITAADGIAVATVQWEAPSEETTVEIRCDPAQSAERRRVGVWTLVFEQGDDDWRIKHAHESVTDFIQYPGCAADS